MNKVIKIVVGMVLTGMIIFTGVKNISNNDILTTNADVKSVVYAELDRSYLMFAKDSKSENIFCIRLSKGKFDNEKLNKYKSEYENKMVKVERNTYKTNDVIDDEIIAYKIL